MMSEQYNPKVSILVAIYNIEKFIGKCIQSILEQDYNNIEVILIDDCSTDNSGKICDAFASKDSRVLVTHHVTNTRLSGVRNTGLSKATGEYIIFVDGDDWLAPDFVSYMLKVITTTKADMAINLVNFTTRNYQQVPEHKIEIWSPEKATAELLFSHISIGAWNKIYRRAFIEKYRLRFRMDLFTAEGYRFINEAAQRANYIGVGCRKIYYYRLNNTESATTKYDIRQSMGALYALKCIEEDLIIRTPYVMGALYVHVWLNHFWNLRQILGTDTISENEELFKQSIRYIKQNVFYVAKTEPSFKKKIKYLLAGVFPVFAAKFQNMQLARQLRADVARQENIDEQI
ncbi:glycosyltransferase family 2 protein [Phascolarctobacterium faecium]|uniref:glycosyltransferase family 2 protein n=1 Tax=Phascolarctobacterium faecium TaxID=33025 RepID=UPI00210D819A|nr:glycosyltransferase family 2 protein [Phascolarctobacterium faecium]MCQ5184595.1 glycosyltransferase [Phascolarctobacterium faecium]